MSFWEIINSLLNRPPEFEYLEKYLDVESERRVDPRRDAALAVSISAATCGALIGGGLWAWLQSPVLSGGAALAGFFIGASWFYRFQSRRPSEQRALARSRSEARQFMEELSRWRRRRQLKSQLGAATGEMLNSAAAYWLRAHVALDADAWELLSPDSQWSQVRERASNAMDSGMAKAMLLAKESRITGTEFFSPQLAAMQPVVEQMRALAKESERLTDRVSIESMDSPQPVDQLREALQDIKGLESAERELEDRRINLQ